MVAVLHPGVGRASRDGVAFANRDLHVAIVAFDKTSRRCSVAQLGRRLCYLKNSHPRHSSPKLQHKTARLCQNQSQRLLRCDSLRFRYSAFQQLPNQALLHNEMSTFQGLHVSYLTYFHVSGEVHFE